MLSHTTAMTFPLNHDDVEELLARLEAYRESVPDINIDDLST